MKIHLVLLAIFITTLVASLVAIVPYKKKFEVSCDIVRRFKGDIHGKAKSEKARSSPSCSRLKRRNIEGWKFFAEVFEVGVAMNF